MLTFAHPKFRSENFKFDSVCSECDSLCSYSDLFLLHCGTLLLEEQTPKFYCNNCIQRKKCNCENSSKSNCFSNCLPTLIDSFFRLSCYTHQDQATSIDISSFLPICNKYHTDSLPRDIRPFSYRLIEDTFFQLYKPIYKNLCKDRLKQLVTYNCQDLLYSCRWLAQVNLGIFCDKHKGKAATHISEDLKGLCNQCDFSKSTNLSSLNDSVNIAVEFLKERAKKVKPNCLNKFILLVLKNSGQNISNKILLNILILEIQDLVSGKEYQYTRCISCFKKLSVGIKRGIQLSCPHAICFKCISGSSHIDRCLIDKEEINHRNYLIEKELPSPVCHYCNAVIYNQKVFQLPCYHYSCEPHLIDGTCYNCGFSFDKWPLKPRISELARNLAFFNQMFCPKHDEMVSEFSLSPYDLLCSSCPKPDHHLDSPQSIASQNIIKISHSALQLLLEPLAYYLKQTTSSCNAVLETKFLKKLNYLGLMSLSDIWTSVNIFNTMTSASSKIKSDDILLFSSVLPSYNFSKKLLHVEENTKIVVNFRNTSDIILRGVIISKGFLPVAVEYTHLSIPPSKITINSYSNQNNELVSSRDFTIFSPKQVAADLELSSKIINFECFTGVYLKSHQTYHELIIELRPSFYYASSSFSKLKYNFLELLKPQKINRPGTILNGFISSPFFGLSLKKVDLL